MTTINATSASTSFTFTMSSLKPISSPSAYSTYYLSTSKNGPAKIIEFKPKGK